MATKRKKRAAKAPAKKARGKSARSAKRVPKRSTRARMTKSVPRKPVKQAAARSAGGAAATDAVRALARRIVDLTISQNDEAVFGLYADNVESVEPGNPPAVGIDAIRQKFTMWRGMVSESFWDARNVWVDGDTIIIEWSGRVTFAATGRQADLNEIAIHEIANGKILRERFYYDRSALQP